MPDRLVPDPVPFTDVPVAGRRCLHRHTALGQREAGQLPINDVSIFEKRLAVDPGRHVPGVAELTVIPSRPPDFAEGADHGRLESIVVNYPDEPVPAAARRAAELARQWGLDASRLAEWAARNADGRDNSPGGSMASTGPQRVSENGPSLSIRARALSSGESYLSVTVSWYDESEEEPSAPA